MFFRKVTSKSNGREYTYVKLIENYREGNKVKQRVIANLGNIDDLTSEKVQGLVSGLSRICGFPDDNNQAFETEKVLNFGEVIALDKVWQTLDAGDILNTLAGHQEASIGLLVELMTINQITRPGRDQGISNWSQNLYLPQLEGKNLRPEQFQNALITLASVKEPLENQLFQKIKDQVGINTETAYCYLIRGFFESHQLESSSKLGYFMGQAHERKQVDMGILATSEGIPLGHRVFMGNLSDAETVPRRVQDIKRQFGFNNCIFVGDQNIITEENLQLMTAYGYDYIVGMEIRFNREVEPVLHHLSDSPSNFTDVNNDLYYKEIKIRGNRYLLCYNPAKAESKKLALENKLAGIEEELKNVKQWIEEKSSKNARVNFYRATGILKNSYCRKYFETLFDEKDHQFSFKRKQEVIDREDSLFGKFVIKTNCQHISPAEMIKAYTNYAEARDELRVIKRHVSVNSANKEVIIRGYIFINILAFLIKKIMENMLRMKGVDMGSKQVLEILEDIKVTVNRCQDSEVMYITPTHGLQRQLLSAVGVQGIPRKLESGATF